eukprot:CAMPEP_0171288934 /NCGR_PEP_ID=MMETSP0790-20130122/70348_1 /TAXON_ID=2925 /ORGANISM="Alexandrium catenella, Strain OF101" /LENGTH=217 /DNA_ID=CAMNT_0011758553 /DNA_START=55 /DNA_END=706 /DNA_ORIENTATION=-
MSCFRAEKLSAGDAAVRSEARRQQPPAAGEASRGLLDGDEIAPELVATFEGERYDPERRRLYVTSGGVLSWTYSASCVGFVYWLFLRVSYIFCSTLHINFTDDSLTSAEMPVYICGCCFCPMGMVWRMEQIDDNTWDRQIYTYCNMNEKSKMSYILKRVIDGNGNKLPAFDEMIQSVSPGGVPGLPQKPAMQIMNGDSCFSCFSDPSEKKGYEMVPP